MPSKVYVVSEDPWMPSEYEPAFGSREEAEAWIRELEDRLGHQCRAIIHEIPAP